MIRKEEDSRWDYTLGLALGLLVLVRPLTLGILLAPLALLQINQWRRQRRIQLPAVARTCSIFLPFVVGYMLYNNTVTGSPFVTGRQFLYPTGLFGFGQEAAHTATYGSLGHTPVKGFLNVITQFGVLSTGLLGWPLLSLVPAVIGFALREKNKWAWTFVLIPFATAGILFFSWYSAIEHGPRHYLDSWPGIVLLTTSGLAHVWHSVKKRTGTTGTNAMILGVAGLFILSFALYLPVRIRDIRGPWLGVDPEIRWVVAEQVELPALVFMDFPNAPADYYCSGFVYNDPFLRAPIVFARHKGASQDSTCRQHFPDRTAYYLYYDPSNRVASITPLQPDL
jgi:hypothetical protein